MPGSYQMFGLLTYSIKIYEQNIKWIVFKYFLYLESIDNGYQG